ncbi:MAG TPA: hypothetical protein PKA41_16560 [Verrucomicrobiota bacterium]|nr:hypothetical protein [Verrucomicrobiota bacterium]
MITIKTHLTRAVALVALAVLVAATARGAATNDYYSQPSVQDLKSETDPTILKRKIWLETEWNSYRDGSDKIEETLGGLWAQRITDDLDWGVRVKLMYDWYIAGDNDSASDDCGIGDTKVATGLAYRIAPNLRVGGGLELRMPTAEGDLGDDVWKLQEFGTLAWDATEWLSFTPTVEYNHSVCEEDGASPQHNVELYFPATVILPHRWSITTRYEAKIDFEDDNYVTQSGKLYLSKSFEKIPINLTASFKRPFNTANKDYQVNLVVTWLL